MTEENIVKSEYKDYTEKLVPIHVTITKKHGNVTFTFSINGFRGEDTGQIYYKGKDVLEVERIMNTNHVIHGHNIPNLGLVLTFSTPETVMVETLPTNTNLFLSKLSSIRPETQTTLSVRQAVSA